MHAVGAASWVTSEILTLRQLNTRLLEINKKEAGICPFFKKWSIVSAIKSDDWTSKKTNNRRIKNAARRC